MVFALISIMFIFICLQQNEVEVANTTLEKVQTDSKLKLDENMEELRKELSNEWSERLK